MLFRNTKILEEKPTDDFLELDDEIQRIADKINRIVTLHGNSVVAYLGPFGSGKTTTLENIKKQSNYNWITFELWRYSDRNKIWDGFVFELSAYLREKSPEEIINKIEGDRWSPISLLIKKYWALLLAGSVLIWLALSYYTWDSLQSGVYEWQKFLQALLKYALPVLLAFLAVIGLGKVLPEKKRPIKRIFELENFLREELDELKKPLVIVVEDIDRTGNEGMVFLETLRNFLKDDKSKFDYPIVVIVPQEPIAFDVTEGDEINNFQRALKLYDFEIYAATTDIWVNGLGTFFKELEPTVTHVKLQAAAESLAGSFGRQVTMRLLKRALRSTAEFVESSPKADPTIAFVLIMSRYITVRKSTGNVVLASLLKRYSSYDADGMSTICNIFQKLVDNTERIGSFDVSFAHIDCEIELEIEAPKNRAKKAHFTLDEKYMELI